MTHAALNRTDLCTAVTCYLAAGIDRSRVEDMENRLKQDVLQEAAQYNNQILVAHENDDFQVVEQWEAVTEVDVQTPLEVYRELSGEQERSALYSIQYDNDTCLQCISFHALTHGMSCLEFASRG